MGIFPTDIPFDESGLNADRWHFQLSEPLNGHNCGALLEQGRTVEPVMTRILRRISGGMGSYLVGAVRVEGGPVLKLGDCAWFDGPVVDDAAEKAAHARKNAEQVALLLEQEHAAAAKAKADADDAEAAALAELEAEIAAEELAKANTDLPPAAAPEAGSAHPPADGAAVVSSKKGPGRK